MEINLARHLSSTPQDMEINTLAAGLMAEKDMVSSQISPPVTKSKGGGITIQYLDQIRSSTSEESNI